MVESCSGLNPVDVGLRLMGQWLGFQTRKVIDIEMNRDNFGNFKRNDPNYKEVVEGLQRVANGKIAE